MESYNNQQKVLSNKELFDKYYEVIDTAFNLQQQVEMRLKEHNLDRSEFNIVSEQLLEIENFLETHIFVDFTSPLIFDLVKRMGRLEGVPMKQQDCLQFIEQLAEDKQGTKAFNQFFEFPLLRLRTINGALTEQKIEEIIEELTKVPEQQMNDEAGGNKGN